jgi:hypothetical protein
MTYAFFQISFVACVRCRGENIHPQNFVLMWQMWEDKKLLSFISGKKWNGSRHLVFWPLGTPTSLRDRVRGLVA